MITTSNKAHKLITESEGSVIVKRRKTKYNPRLCPELDMIGFHVHDDNGNCRYCGLTLI